MTSQKLQDFKKTFHDLQKLQDFKKTFHDLEKTSRFHTSSTSHKLLQKYFFFMCFVSDLFREYVGYKTHYFYTCSLFSKFKIQNTCSIFFS